jgi:hypothetical protein
MSRRFLFLLLAAGIGTGWAAAGEPVTKRSAAQKAVSERIARLIADLSSDSFETRQRAVNELEAMGPAVGAALRKAITSGDPEARRLALEVAEKIARKMETAQVLEPKRLRLAYKDVPLRVAVQDFARVSGAQIQLDGVKDSNRKVTLDTGYTSFWDALDKFCAATGLAEKVFDSAATPTPNNQEMIVGGAGWVGRRRIVMWGPRGPIQQQQNDIIPALQNGQFILTDADKVPPRTIYQAGALRFRALPAGTSMGQLSTLKGDNEIIFGLELIPEPSLAWERVQAIRIDRVVDDQGQLLSASEAHPSGEAPSNDGDEVIFWGGYDGGPNQNTNTGQRLPMRLTLGRKPSALLRELTGVATIKMQTSSQTLATIDNILSAKDKSVKASDGSFLKVVEVKREDSGRIEIHVRVDAAQDDQAMANPWGWGGMAWGGRWNTGDQEVDSSVSTGHLVLYDARGHLVRLLSKDQVADENGVISGEEYRFVYQVAKGQPDPAKLVLQGRRGVTIEVPFTLRNVPLRAVPGGPKPAPAPAVQPQQGAPQIDW